MTDTFKCDLCGKRLPCKLVKLSGGKIIIRFENVSSISKSGVLNYVGDQEIDERLCPECMGKTIKVEGLDNDTD